jgi:hypothetical protein
VPLGARPRAIGKNVHLSRYVGGLREPRGRPAARGITQAERPTPPWAARGLPQETPVRPVSSLAPWAGAGRVIHSDRALDSLGCGRCRRRPGRVGTF